MTQPFAGTVQVQLHAPLRSLAAGTIQKYMKIAQNLASKTINDLYPISH